MNTVLYVCLILGVIGLGFMCWTESDESMRNNPIRIAIGKLTGLLLIITGSYALGQMITTGLSNF
jgi:hypothetical protein